MSDKRANYYFGTSIMIAAVAIGLVMAIPMAQSNPAITSGMNFFGHVVVKHFDSEGNILSYQQTDNEIMIGGKNKIRDASIGGNVNFDDLAIGTDGSQINRESLDALKAKINVFRDGAQTVTNAISGGTGATVTQTATFTITTANSSDNIQEAGLFNGANGSMLSRVAMPNPFDVFTNDQVELAFKITYGTVPAVT